MSRNGTQAVTRRGGRLADGMAIGAKLQARLLGMRVLTLDAEIAVTPERVGRGRRVQPVSPERSLPAESRLAPGSRSHRNGEMAEAGLCLEASVAELAAARERMP